jgi:hypothetical protein
MTRWERLEAWLFDQDLQNGEFTAVEYAAAQGFEVEEATRDIQGYLSAQRVRRGSQTLFVLRRVPGTRTTSSRWHVGVSVKDARAIGTGFSDDVARRALRAFEPDLLRLAERNPRAKRQVEAQVRATIGHAVEILALASQGTFDDDGEGS